MVKAEDSWPRGPGFKPPLWRPFFRHHSLGSKLGTKIVENSNLALCCNPANGRVDFVELSAYKIQLRGTEWIVSLSADWDQSPTTTKKKHVLVSGVLLILQWKLLGSCNAHFRQYCIRSQKTIAKSSQSHFLHFWKNAFTKMLKVLYFFYSSKSNSQSVYIIIIDFYEILEC